MLGSDIQDVVSSAGDILNIWHIERLRINVAIHGGGEQLAKLVAVYVGGREQRLRRVLTGSGVVVVVGGYTYLPEQDCRNQAEQNEQSCPSGSGDDQILHVHFSEKG